MGNPSAQHSTIILARTYNAPIARVFAAVSDPVERIRVHTGSKVLTYEFEQAELHAGGRDVFRFGQGGGRRFRGETIYHDVAPERRIICTDIVSTDGLRLWVGVTTLEFSPVGLRTQVKVTAHIVWLDGADEIEGADGRYAALLDDLGRYFERD
jgi:uncharacterized protein YndB with AHSA1/START domain